MSWFEKKREIQAMVNQILEEAGIDAPPVPVERIARLLGARVSYVPFEGELSGMLYQQAQEVILGVNSLHPKVRQRFTIAHELGHLRLHDQGQLYVDRGYRVLLRDEHSGQATDQLEIEANTFAAELLMPTVMLKRDLEGKTIDYEDDDLLRDLADRYKVSVQAMTFRLTNLGLLNKLGF